MAEHSYLKNYSHQGRKAACTLQFPQYYPQEKIFSSLAVRCLWTV